EKPARPQLYTKKHRQPKKAENKRGGLPWKRSNHLVVHHQMNTPEKLRVSNSETGTDDESLEN
ncbi:hypothetical protein LEMLEM_LOCUS5954, partial [Lemmus lemmus]